MEKCFGYVGLVVLIQQHMVPKLSQVNKICSYLVSPSKSILVGCFHSVPFVKALLHEDVAEFDGEFKDADDCVQLEAGTFDEVSDTLIRGVVSTKSCVVTSPSKLSKFICKELAESAIKLSSDDANMPQYSCQ